ncbi:unnamed protein product [Brassica rapa]|uniref:Thaumatin-like protein n=1 Tax=Brassica campestris TaxID=3711 RepID=A0A8D9HJL1_BRACM|nr:unnamed protein product [Brassica rapa]
MGYIKVSSFLFVIFFLINGGYSTTFTVVNQCNYTVWPGLLSGAGTAPFQNPTTGKFTCVTGDCGSSKIECSGAGGKPPATIAEFTLNGASNLDFFDISLVDGYNIPVTIVPYGGAAGVGKCMAAGCAADLNVVCPPQLKLTMEDTAGEWLWRARALAKRLERRSFAVAARLERRTRVRRVSTLVSSKKLARRLIATLMTMGQAPLLAPALITSSLSVLDVIYSVLFCFPFC